MTMFMVLSSWHSHCESSPGSFDECRLSAGWLPTLRPDQTNRFGLWVRWLAAVIRRHQYIWWTGSRRCLLMCSESLPSTTLSTTFDRKLRLEIGRYDAGSLRSIVRFFSSGRTMALLQQHGNMSCWNDALQTAAMVGARTWRTCLMS